MNFLLAPNSFKNCLSSVKVAHAMEQGIKNAMPGAQIFKTPFSDGGDGLIEVFLQKNDAVLMEAETFDPLMRPIKAKWLIYHETAIIETALACGLALLSFPQDRFPLAATSYGVGVLIKEAIKKGIRKIVLGLGGSATTDGGSGVISALGIKLLDKNGKELKMGGGFLTELVAIDTNGIDKAILETEFIVLTDVINPLLGKNGTANIFAPQKGATREEVEILNKALTNFASIVEHKTAKKISDIPGTGAAGGLAAGIMAFFETKIEPGAEWVAKHNGFFEHLKNSDWIITGEGKLDSQTLYGKVPHFVLEKARAHNKKVAAFAGIIEEGITKMPHTFDYIDCIMKGNMTLKDAITKAEKHLERLLYTFIMSVTKKG